MLAICRITTVVAMLLHSLLGCSLHHAASCDSHAHSVYDDVCDADGHPSVQHDNDCCHDHEGHDHSRGAEGSCTSEFVAGSETNIAPVCPGCESGPCDGRLPGCHSTGSCSFVPSSDVDFVCDAVFVGYILYDFDPSMARVRTVCWQQERQRQFAGVEDSLSHCASLCTWLI
ncbi:hypothetical protein TBK1r_43050 [Stieleria magnilauensis]|uniref:Uncharacterized protein n=1 Tax=Stieleria magnilauensis TaxID=2527963 RepID=A0ABX5XVK7_9BACT|nr:hypothetical protein TBK1r_43050 [Planctomycetes bacterium TBK1r]